MTIKPVDKGIPITRPTTGTHLAQETKASFADLLASTRQGQPLAEQVKNSAERLHLDMLRQAIAVDTPTHSSDDSLSYIFSSSYRENATSLTNFVAQEEEILTDEATKGSKKPDSPQSGAFDDIISKAGEKFGVDPRLIKAVIKAESGFIPHALSHAGAQGLMQLMPSTAKMLGVTDPFDPEQNIFAGTRFLKDLLDRYGGNIDTALAAYNWGPGNLNRKTKALPEETRRYVATVRQYFDSFQHT